MPFVVLALSDAGGIVLMQLRDGEAFPFAERDFRKPLIAPESVAGTRSSAVRSSCMVSPARLSGLDT